MKTAGGRIVNLASAVGVQGTAGFLPYAMAKEAMRTLTRCRGQGMGSLRHHGQRDLYGRGYGGRA
jgi:NAD(P)-dependent dehydrogenase (short-subunit alcohol dehydrogenase family)